MKVTGERWHLKHDNQHQLNGFIEHVHRQWELGKDLTVQFLKSDRSTSQNSFFYALYRDIASQLEDKTLLEVKADCKLRYGVVIRKAADPEWGDWYDKAIKPWSMESKLTLMEEYPITSQFTKDQASEYIDSIIRGYTQQGFWLADPRKNV